MGSNPEGIAQRQQIVGQQPPHSGQNLQSQNTNQRAMGNIGINVASAQSVSGQLGRNQSQGLTINSGRANSSGYNIGQRIGVDSATNQNSRTGHAHNSRGVHGRRTNNLNSGTSSNQNSQARDSILRGRNGGARQQQTNESASSQAINPSDLESIVPRHTI